MSLGFPSDFLEEFLRISLWISLRFHLDLSFCRILYPQPPSSSNRSCSQTATPNGSQPMASGRCAWAKDMLSLTNAKERVRLQNAIRKSTHLRIFTQRSDVVCDNRQRRVRLQYMIRKSTHLRIFTQTSDAVSDTSQRRGSCNA